jgi:Tol biopolymer transport system component
MKRRAFLVSAVVVLAAAAYPARAAFPGANGRITFSSNQSIAGGDPSSADTEIFTMTSTGTGFVQLTVDATSDFDPKWSADGTKIVWASFRDGGGDSEIFVMDATGANVHQLTDNTFSDYAPSWSPNGRRIAFTTDVPGNTDIFVMDSVDRNGDGVGDHRSRLTIHSTSDSQPDWSPDGRRIAFTATRRGQTNDVFVMKARREGRTNRPRSLSQGLGGDSSANWAPEGTRIAFISARGVSNDIEIWLMKSNGSDLEPITENLDQDVSPAWSPDATKIVFVSDRDGNLEIYSMNADGTSQTRLTNTAGQDTGPDWQPT